MRYPAELAVDYYRALMEILRLLQEAIQAHWEELAAAIRSAETIHTTATAAEAATDALALAVRADITVDPTHVLRRIMAQAERYSPEEIAERVFYRVYEKVNRDFRAALEQYIRSKRGEIPPALASQLGGAVTAKGRELLTLLRDAFIAQNVALIRSIPQQFHYRVQNLVWEAVRTGQSTAWLKEQLQHEFHLAASRAKLIARDQIGKLYGQLNMVRQVDAGIKHFRWRTVGDNRVREKHRQLEGKVFSWDTGANGLYPGQDYQCRCWAEPVWEEIVAVEEPKPPPTRPRVREAPAVKEAPPTLKPPPMPGKPMEGALPSPEQIWGATDIPTLLDYARQLGVEPTLKQVHKIATYEQARQWDARFGLTTSVEEFEATRAAVAALRDVVARLGSLQRVLEQAAQKYGLKPGRVRFELSGNGHEVYHRGQPVWGVGGADVVMREGGPTEYVGIVKVTVNPDKIRPVLEEFGLRRIEQRPRLVAMSSDVLGIDQMTPANVSNIIARTVYVTTLHELGHVVHYLALTPDENNELEALYRELSAQKIAVSSYALSDVYEFWAEAFAAYMSPWANRQRMPEKIMRFVARVVKRLEAAARG